MRELVYLSERKLEQFLPEVRRRMPRGKWQLNTPVGGLGLEPEALDAERARAVRLERIVRHVSSSARWFTEQQDLAPGSWVEFEAPLNYRATRGTASGMVLFVDVPHPVDGYETGGSIRLLLHGSASHLTEDAVLEEVKLPALSEVAEVPVGHVGSCGPVWTELVTSPTAAGRLLGSLRDQPSAGSDEPPDLGLPLGLAEGTRQVLDSLDEQLHPETAAWMCGFARVTASLRAPADGRVRYVVGSPLYVEYAAG